MLTHLPRWYLFLLLSLLSQASAAEVTRSADAETGLRKWHLVEGNLEVELVQRLPDQTRGFFMARGFSAAIAEEIAVSCIFQTIIRNTGRRVDSGTVSVDLAQWRVIHEGREQGIRLKEPWMANWTAAAVSEPSRLAFRWALFPTQQEFLADDYNWGMTAIGLPPGTVFDLDLVWQEDGKPRTERLAAIECAPDVERLQ
ncbi:MAG TPA: hypothetical protein VET88_00825 [Gammaproteobacteria bacterium]|nr:hypothetical protein [Gammaproteobacteria bacterium]